MQKFSKINQGSKQPPHFPSVTLWGTAEFESRSLHSEVGCCLAHLEPPTETPPEILPPEAAAGREWAAGRERVAAPHPRLGPWDPGDLQGMSRKTKRKEAKRETSSLPLLSKETGLSPQSLGINPPPLSVSNTQETIR